MRRDAIPALEWLGTARAAGQRGGDGAGGPALVRRHGEALKAIVTLSYAATPAAGGGDGPWASAMR